MKKDDCNAAVFFLHIGTFWMISEVFFTKISKVEGQIPFAFVRGKAEVLLRQISFDKGGGAAEKDKSPAFQKGDIVGKADGIVDVMQYAKRRLGLASHKP